MSGNVIFDLKLINKTITSERSKGQMVISDESSL